MAIDDRATVDNGAFGESGLLREQMETRTSAPCHLEDRGIVGVDDRPVTGLLVLEDSRLRRRIRLDARMPIEMVGRKVQHHRDPRMERIDLLELKAARLD